MLFIYMVFYNPYVPWIKCWVFMHDYPKKGITMGGGNLMDDVAQETVCVAIKRFNKISIIK